MNVDRMLREELTSEQVTEWMAYSVIEPFGAPAWKQWGMNMLGGIANLLRFRGGGIPGPTETTEIPMTDNVFGGLKALFGRREQGHGQRS